MHVRMISGTDHNGVEVQASEYPETGLTIVIMFFRMFLIEELHSISSISSSSSFLLRYFYK